jgi:hypothetical protein
MHYCFDQKYALQATELKDRIYAFLSLTSDIDTIEICPDYVLTCEEAYVVTAKALIERNHIDTLSYSQIAETQGPKLKALKFDCQITTIYHLRYRIGAGKSWDLVDLMHRIRRFESQVRGPFTQC